MFSVTDFEVWGHGQNPTISNDGVTAVSCWHSAPEYFQEKSLEPSSGDFF
jgi:hypothetical protein